MITYNHEKYISQAIEGVLSQETTFAIKLVIGEDCSTDQTRTICEQFAQKFPDKVFLLPKMQNIGLKENYVRTLKNCKTKYIAYCEGDDFWTDSLKLQQQYEILENNPDYVAVYHDDFILKERDIAYQVYGEKVQNAGTEDIILNHFIPSLSIFFRNVFTAEHYDLIKVAGCMDLSTELVLSLFGRFYYLNKNMATYRIHEGGVTASYVGNIRRTLDNIRYYQCFNVYSQERFQQSLKQKSDSELEYVKSIWFVNQFRFKCKRRLWLFRFILLYYPGGFWGRTKRAIKELTYIG